MYKSKYQQFSVFMMGPRQTSIAKHRYKILIIYWINHYSRDSGVQICD